MARAKDFKIEMHVRTRVPVDCNAIEDAIANGKLHISVLEGTDVYRTPLALTDIRCRRP